MVERTPLMRAVANNDLTGVFEILNDGNVDIFAKDENGRTALDWARIYKNELATSVLAKTMEKRIKEIRAEIVAKSGVEVQIRNINNRQRTLVVEALNAKDNDAIMKIIRDNKIFRDVVEVAREIYFLDVESEDGNTPLILAAGGNVTEIVDAVLELGADINYTNKLGHTALTWASICGHHEIVKLLLSRGADVYRLNFEGRSPLHYACLYGKPKVVSCILDFIFSRFGSYRDKHPISKADPAKWINYSVIMETFIETRDNFGYRAIDLVPNDSNTSNFPLFTFNGETNRFECDTNTAVASKELDQVVSHEIQTEGEENILLCQDCSYSPPKNNSSQIPLTANDPLQVNLASQPKPPANNSDIQMKLIPSSVPGEILSPTLRDSNNFRTTKSSNHSLNASLPTFTAADGNIVKELIAEAYDHIAKWRECAASEIKRMQPIPCWNGCNFTSQFERMFAHIRNDCTHRKARCSLCHVLCLSMDLKKHEHELCPKRRVGCPNAWSGCRQLVPSDSLENHLHLRCIRRLVLCRLNCGAQVAFGDREAHEATFCANREIKCEKCFQIMCASGVQSHYLGNCPERIVRCTLGCGVRIKLKDQYHHENNVCRQPCRWECGKSIGPVEKRRLHELQDCLRRIVPCRNGCGIQGLSAQLSLEHELHQCSQTKLTCPFACGKILFRKAMSIHLHPYRGDCKERPVRCPSNLEGWRVSLGTDLGIVLKYRRSTVPNIPAAGVVSVISVQDKSDAMNESKEKTNLSEVETFISSHIGLTKLTDGGRDQLYIRFENRQVWVDVWGSDILPIERVSGKKKKGEKDKKCGFDCGWVSFSDLDDHLCNECIHRSVWIGGDLRPTGEGLEVITQNKEVKSSIINPVFLGQQTRYEDAIPLAEKRIEVESFVATSPPRQTCEFCSTAIPIALMDRHLRRDCEHFVIRCTLGCGAKLARRELDFHLNQCPKKSVTCELCGAEMWAEEASGHLELNCHDRIIPCSLGCDCKDLKARDLETHCTQICILRPYTCECGTVMPYNEKDVHQVADCPMKLSPCPQGCGMMIKRDLLDKHAERDCINKHVFYSRPVNCPLGCGTRLRRKDILAHVAGVCELRLSSCPNLCGNTFKMTKLGTHLKTCPRRQLCCNPGMKPCSRLLHLWFYKPNDDDASSETSNSKTSSSKMRRIIAGIEEEDDEDNTSITESENGELDYNNSTIENQNDGYDDVNVTDGQESFNNSILNNDVINSASFDISDLNSTNNSSLEGDEGGDSFPVDEEAAGDTIERLASSISTVGSPLKSILSTSKAGSRRNTARSAYSNMDYTGATNTARSTIVSIYDTNDHDHDRGGSLTKRSVQFTMRSDISADTELSGRDTSRPKQASRYSLKSKHSTDKSSSTNSTVKSTSTTKHQSSPPSPTKIIRKRNSVKYLVSEDMSSSVVVEDQQMHFRENLRMYACPRHSTTALMYAVKAAEEVLLDHILFLTQGEDVDMENRAGETALTIACGLGRLESVQLLVENGADVNIETGSGRTPLIEAVIAGNIPIVEFLIKNGADVTYRPKKHSKAAIGWARQMGLWDLLRSLELGAVVQLQVKSLMLAIGRGDVSEVEKIVVDGEPFDPQNIRNFHKRMEELYAEFKAAEIDAAQTNQQLISLRQNLVESKRLADIAEAEIAVAKTNLDSITSKEDHKRDVVTKCFEEFEHAAHQLHQSDLEEVGRVKVVEESIIIAGLACGLAVGILPAGENIHYGTSGQELKSWWPLVATALLDSKHMLRRIRTFNWKSLQGDQPSSRERILSLSSLLNVLKPLVIKKRIEMLSYNNTLRTKPLPKLRTMTKILMNLGQKNSMKNSANNDDDDDDEESNVIPEVEWDSDAEDAGSGKWVKGEWVPDPPKKKKDWWNRAKKAVKAVDAISDIQNESTSPYRKHELKAPPIVDLTKSNQLAAVSSLHNPSDIANSFNLKEEKKEGHEQGEEEGDYGDNDDEHRVTEKFVDCMMLLLMACERHNQGLIDANEGIHVVRDARAALDGVKSRTQPVREKARSEKSMEEMLERELTSKLKANRGILRKANRYREKLRVAKLLNQVTPTGHTCISWAASYGFYEGFDLLLLHGAPVGFTEDTIHLSANLIMISYRIYRCSVVATAAVKSGEAGIRPDDPGAQVVEKVFKLRARRRRFIAQLKYQKKSHRLPIPEAAYTGHWEIIKRTELRRVFHAGACTTWIHPSAPYPYRRPKRKLPRGKTMNMIDCLYRGISDLGASTYLPDRGWVPVDDAEAPFGESLREIPPIWEELLKRKNNTRLDRERIRLITSEVRKLREANIITKQSVEMCNFRKCIELAETVGCSIDTETPDGLTVLIVAAEENVAGLNHEYMLNDDGVPVLAVKFLLDRLTHRPAIDLETTTGLTALSHACFLGRVHVAEALLERGAEINRKNRDGRTALHFAATNGSIDTCRLLIEHGANIEEKDNAGQTPFDLADKYGFSDVMSVIAQIRSGNVGMVRYRRGNVIDTIPCILGCGLSIYPHEMDSHCLGCSLRPVSCPLGCGEKYLLLKLVDEHIEEVCMNKEIQCELCQRIYCRYEAEHHQKVVCSMRSVTCELGCGNTIHAHDIPNHLRNCLYRLIPCPDECGEQIPYITRQAHLKSDCINRRRACPLKCCALVAVRVLDRHVKDICPLRPESCKWCQKISPFIENVKHENVCSLKQVNCPLKCGTKLDAGSIPNHNATTCKHRFIPCTLGCELKVRVVDMDQHINTKCSNKMIECPRGCLTEDEYSKDKLFLPAKQMQLHLTLTCPYRTLKCAKCEEEVISKDLESHKEFDCSRREVQCRQPGCTKRLPLSDRDSHERFECRRRMVTCPQGCDKLVTALEISRHMARKCEMRYEDCPLRCGASLRYCHMATHVEVECVRRKSALYQKKNSREKSYDRDSMSPSILSNFMMSSTRELTSSNSKRKKHTVHVALNKRESSSSSLIKRDDDSSSPGSRGIDWHSSLFSARSTSTTLSDFSPQSFTKSKSNNLI